MDSDNAWHSQEPAAVLAELDSTPDGLTEEEARSRLATYGPNQLSEQAGRTFLRRVWDQFQNALIYVLMGAACITALLGHWVDTGVIVAVVVINALVGVIQEGKAEKALLAIRALLSITAIVQRSGQRHTVPAESLVPGDLVHLQSGDSVPADLRLLRVRELRIDEAILTGESEPASKTVESVATDAPLAERFCMVYSGTLVTAGTATGVVVATGADTEVGRISGLLNEVEPLATPLLRKINHFARWLSVATLILAGTTLLVGWLWRGFSIQEMFLVAVGLAVALIPEGLPAILTITLAVGVRRMARRNAIIRQLPAVETLGSLTVVCTDKTGTLTRNEMTVTDIITRAGYSAVSGVGYDPDGELAHDGLPLDVSAHQDIQLLARAALLCNDATLHFNKQQWQITGDPTEGALVTMALKCDLDSVAEIQAQPRLDVIPFESEHRFMASLHHDHNGRHFVFIKGAPERLLEMCRYELNDTASQPITKGYWQDRAHSLAEDGKRVLALAYLEVPTGKTELVFQDVLDDLTLLGLVAMIDPPRPEAISAIASAQAGGIRVKMITGDHVGTAAAIARSMNIGSGLSPVNGAMLEKLNEEELQVLVAERDVFARTSPEHKLLLVQALQSRNQVVAMTGDGVNDAPALKQADVGIAMGHKGTEAAKQAARMVLADDNFASIIHAVREGRVVYDNIRKSLLFILPTNGAEALSILAAVILGFMMPITPVQILWINMVTAVTLSLTLAFEPAENDVMERPPRSPAESLFTGFLIWRVGFVSVLMVMAVFGLFVWFRSRGTDLDTARTIAINTLVSCEIFYLLNTRMMTASALDWQRLWTNLTVWYAIAALIVMQAMFTYSGPFQKLFDTRPLSLTHWGVILMAALAVFGVVELEKFVFRRSGAVSRYTPAPHNS
ncbi:HAD-IC family P-type ATPase [Marinobacter changyiensis]|uniref:HAD-IC family P-type ATPase n=1 Tax=Marinobacter changyiensis TaxID=2604091 RepID=UPI00126595FD|nr:HAD-IC family P-type ATPase [Marinobacter changyiensis]